MSKLNLSIVLNAVDRISKPMQRTQAQLKSFQDRAAKIDAFRSLKASTEAVSRSMQENQARVAALSRELRSTTEPSKRLQSQFNQAVQTARQSKAAYQQNTQQLHKMRVEMKAAGFDTKKLGEESRRLNAQISQTTKRLSLMQRVQAGGNSARRIMGGIGSGIASVTRALGWIGLAGSAVAGAFGTLSRVVGPFFSTAAQFEKYGVMLESIEGSSEKAKASMDWVSDFAVNTPLELDDVMGAFVKLRTFGMDPMNGTMQSLVDMNSRMGGSGESLEGMIQAVGKAWSKNKLQGEEVISLMQRGVPVWDLLAKRSGKTAQELQEMSSKGLLGRDAIAALIEEMGKMSAGASAKQMKTWNGLLSNIGDQWTRFQRMVMDSGPFEQVKEILANILATVDRMAANGELAALAERVANGFLFTLNVAKAVYTVMKAWYAIMQPILWVAKAIGTVLVWPFVKVYELVKFIGSLLNDVIAKIDKITGSGIGNLIGKSMAFLAAGLGSNTADAALAADATTSNRFGAARTRVASRSDQNVDVGGVLEIKIDQEGRARVGKMEGKGNMDLQADMGWSMVGAGL